MSILGKIVVPGVVLLAPIPVVANEFDAIFDAIKTNRQAFIECIEREAVVLGRGNQESAETIMRGVTAKCRPEEDALRTSYLRTPVSRLHVERLMIRDRTEGEDAGITALLSARSD